MSDNHRETTPAWNEYDEYLRLAAVAHWSATHSHSSDTELYRGSAGSHGEDHHLQQAATSNEAHQAFIDPALLGMTANTAQPSVDEVFDTSNAQVHEVQWATEQQGAFIPHDQRSSRTFMQSDISAGFDHHINSTPVQYAAAAESADVRTRPREVDTPSTQASHIYPHMYQSSNVTSFGDDGRNISEFNLVTQVGHEGEADWQFADHFYQPYGNHIRQTQDHDRSTTLNLDSDPYDRGNLRSSSYLSAASGHFFDNAINTIDNNNTPFLDDMRDGDIRQYFRSISEAGDAQPQASGSHAQQVHSSTSGQADTEEAPRPDPFRLPTARPRRSTTLTSASYTPSTRGSPRRCVDCDKVFRPTNNTSEERCRRCNDKFNRLQHRDTPPGFQYDETAGGLAESISQIYEAYPALDLPTDDFQEQESQERYWVERFLAAANQAYDGAQISEGPPVEQQNKAYQDQQVVLNQKPHQKPGGMWYQDFWVTRRFTLLFHAILNLHRGGSRPYAQGGDNAGYGSIDQKLTCSKRLEKVESILKYDKRTVINVIEGRGVCAFAENPAHFVKRKVQNKSSNNTKKQQIEKGKGRSTSVVDSEDGDDDREDDGVAGVFPEHALPEELRQGSLTDLTDYDGSGMQGAQEVSPVLDTRKRKAVAGEGLPSPFRSLPLPKRARQRSETDTGESTGEGSAAAAMVPAVPPDHEAEPSASS